MKLNHINLIVNDLSEAQTFFEQYFDFQLLGRKEDLISVMSDGEGFSLVLSKAHGNETVQYPEGFHVGFIVETPERVDKIYQALKEGNIQMNREPGNIRDGYTFYFTALGGIQFEVTCHNMG